MSSKIFTFFGLVWLATSGYSQEFSTEIVVTTAQGSTDTFTLGYDPSASYLLDSIYGDVDISDLQLSEQSIRLSHMDLMVLDHEAPTHMVDSPESWFYQSVTDVLPKECITTEPLTLINCCNPFTAMMIPISDYPITITWTSEDFDNACLSESAMTAWQPDLIPDVGGPSYSYPSAQLQLVKMATSDSIHIESPSGHTVINESGDSLKLLFFLLADDSIVSTANESQVDVHVFPNPVTENLIIAREDSKLLTYHISDCRGQLIQAGKLSGSQIDVSQLIPGLYVIELSTADGSRAVSRFVKE